MLRFLLRIPGFLIRFATVVGLTGMGLATVSMYLSPDITVIPAFFGLSYPFWLAVALFGLVYSAVRKRWKLFGLTACCLLLSWKLMQATLGFGTEGCKTCHEMERSVSILSYNVRLFDLYNWTTGDNTREEIYAFLDSTPVDVICFQEFFHTVKPGVADPRKELMERLGYSNYHDKYTHEMHDVQYFGLLTFSRYPIVGKGEVSFESDPNNFCIYTDLAVHGDTIRVYNAHLASIRLKTEDYRAIDRGPDQKETKRLVSRISGGYQRRASQIEAVVSSIAGSPHPVVLCVDLNDTPISYAHAQLESHLKDSFRGRHFGFGGTHIGLFPFLRIDYAMHSEELNAHYLKLHEDVELSDHHPLELHLSW
jgi:endonuclease/exonuclease/phosphatase family metal-dependent hydrolase